MPKFPEPPATLALTAQLKPFPAGTLCWRIYFGAGPHPISWDGFRFFGPTAARFDHHDDPPAVQAKGVLYAASSAVTCLAEVFQATRVIDRNHRQPWLVG